MNILLVTTSFPPFVDMQTIRNIKFINSIVENGNSVTVISPDADWIMDNSNQLYLNNEVRYWYTRPPIFIRLAHFLSSSKNLKLFSKLFNVLSNYLLFPDTFSGWSAIAKRYLDKRIDEEEFDLVITSSGSFTAHFVGYWMNRKKKVKWVCDYGDPWGVDVYGRKKVILSRMEKFLLRKCNGLFFTTESTIQAYKKSDLLSSIPIFLLPCGFDYHLHPPKVRNYQQGIQITYTGVAYSLSRNLSNAVIASANLSGQGVSLNIVGSFSNKFVEVAEKASARNIYFSGKVSYPKSLEIINDSDILLHIGNYGTTQIPGKTYIYLGTPKPILYIRQEKEFDPTHELLNTFSGIITTHNTIESIELSLRTMIENYGYYLQKSQERVTSPELKRYSWGHLGEYYNECLKGIAAKKEGF